MNILKIQSAGFGEMHMAPILYCRSLLKTLSSLGSVYVMTRLEAWFYSNINKFCIWNIKSAKVKLSYKCVQLGAFLHTTEAFSRFNYGLG